MKTPIARKLPSGKWNVQVSVHGVRHSITKDTKAEAERAAMLLKIRFVVPAKAEEKTIGTLIDEYIDSKVPVLSPVTILDYRDLRRHRFRRYMNVRYKDIKSWQKALEEEIRLVSAKTVQSGWYLCAAAFKYADLPVPKVDLPQVKSKPRPYLTADEIPAFLDAIKGEYTEMLMLLCLHGMRASEACAIRWQDIDLKRKLIHVCGTVYREENGEWIRKESTKTEGSNRYVPIMIPRLEELLKAADKKKPLCSSSPPHLYKRVNAICDKHGFRRIGSHGLRRSFASLAYHLGVPERIAMEIGGWTSVQTMHRIYIQVSKSDIEHYGTELRSFYEMG